MKELEKYYTDLMNVKASGMAVEETSYYGCLEQFINEIGKTIKPFVRIIINTRNIGAGIPDGGLFSADQFLRDQNRILDFKGTPPSRGVVEIKSTSENINNLANSEQVKKYLEKYGQVLITNYYQFIVLVFDRNKKIKHLEKYCIAKDENEFWSTTPKLISKLHGERIKQFLLRTMLNMVPITDPKNLAWFLASYARDALFRIENKELKDLEDVKHALEESLGIKFSGAKGNHFFKSTLIQTLFYGIFSAWILYIKDTSKSEIKYDWRLAGWYLKVPMIKALFSRIANPMQLGRLDIVETLDLASATLNRINSEVFFKSFDENEAVIYFYEPFLQEFDQELRKDLGVWYTPKEIVKYMVEKVDSTLKNEMNIIRGIADENVYILDPACGTGTYLIEILRRIHKTYQEEGEDAFTVEDIKKAATKRIFGFEILPAPYIISHLQMSLYLQNLGINLIEEKDRLGVFLTNSLTGWEPSADSEQLLDFPEMQEEKDAAANIKCIAPILVIIGNPPYNAFAGTSPKEECGLVEAYKENLSTIWGIKKYNLDDLYIRFFRLAEKRIAEKSGIGIVCFITNFSFTYEPSFVSMRQHLSSNFSKIWIDSMNGDSRETGKKTPNGKSDPSVFSTDFNKEGIRKGTAITTLLKIPDNNKLIQFREFWGVNKLKLLLESKENYSKLEPSQSNKYLLRRVSVNPDYYLWPSINELPEKSPYPAFMESRANALIDIDKDKIESRMKDYFNTNLSFNDLSKLRPELTKNFARFNASTTRIKILKTEPYCASKIVRYCVRPFDTRFAYFTTTRPLWNETRPDLFNNHFAKNKYIVTRVNTEKEQKGSPIYFTTRMIDCQALARNVSVIPFIIKEIPNKNKEHKLDLFEDKAIENLSKSIIKYLEDIEYRSNYDDFWYHCLSIGFSLLYIDENKDGIKNDYPRIPLPNNYKLLEDSIQLGKKLSLLLDLESDVKGITSELTELYKNISVISNKNNSIITEDDLNLDSSWGTKTQQGIMPGRGKYFSRDYSDFEYRVLTTIGKNQKEIYRLLGSKTFDIYISKEIYWKNIPEKVWNYHIGGYQVIKKWLSYRVSNIINRPLKSEEVREVVSITRRITAIVLLTNELDKNYTRIKENCYML